MFSYIAYGLSIRSELSLPQLLPRHSASDVVIRAARVHPLPSEATGAGSCFRVTPQEVRLFYKEVGRLLVLGGREIVVDPASGADEQVLRLCIMGPALAVLLRQRGRLVLHASTLAVKGSAVAFLGRAGSGKSSLAAALYKRGYDVVADDVTAACIDGASATVFPSFPALRLWPDAAAALGFPLEEPGQDRFQFVKVAWRVARGFRQTPLPIGCLYVLTEGTRQGAEPLPPQKAFVEIVRHTYAARLLQDSGKADSHFRQCARLASRVPVRRLTMRRRLSTLPDLARLVEEDFADDVSRTAAGRSAP